METVEEFGSFEEIDPWKYSSHSVPLKNALDVNELSHGVDFEIDISAISDDKDECEEDNFRREEIHKYLKPECTGFWREDSPVSDSEDAMTPFQRMAFGMIKLTEDGGVLKKTIRHGTGPLVPDGAIVRVHYNGYLEFSDEPFDSSRLRNRQHQFTLSKGEAIRGWEVGVASMRRTELARFMITSEYAYGSMGCPPRIPPEATIMFEIELINFVDHQAADEFTILSKEEKEQATLEQLIAVANAEREAGNDFFQQKMMGKASRKYGRAVHLLEGVRLKNEDEEKHWKAIILKLYLNQSLCNLRMSKPKPAITQCRKALEIDTKNVKANFRLGQAYMQLGEYSKSRDHLVKSGRLSPGNKEIRQELEKLDRQVRKYKAIEKTMYTKMIQFTVPGSKPTTTEPAATVSNEDDEDTPTAEELARMKAIYTEKFKTMKSTWTMTEIVLPVTLSETEVKIAQDVAATLELQTEKFPNCGLRIYKEEREETNM